MEIIGKITSISYEKTDINGNKFMFFDVMQNGFYKLSNYTRKFNKKLADDYDEILEEDLNEEFDDEDY